MSPTVWLAELRHRGVLKVAAGYLAISWLVLQAVSLLFQNFGAPGWALKAFTTVVVVGFPVACLLAWGLEFTSQGVHTASPLAAETPATPRRSDTLFGVVLLLILGLVGASVVHQWRSQVPSPAATNEVSAAPAPATAASSPAAPASAARAAVDRDAPPSIAVLPFVDMSEEHDQQYLGDGIAEELLNALASIEGLNVAARTSSFSFHGKGVGVKEIGDTLHVRHVLEGSVRRSGPKLRVTAQLIDVDTGFHLYSQSYDRQVKDIFDIQNEIAREIVNALKPKLGIGKDANLVRQGTTNLEAYNLRLKAHQWLINPNPAAAKSAIADLTRATELDPEYSDAWGDLAYIQGYAAFWAPDPVAALMDASEAATKATMRAPDNVMGLMMSAYRSVLFGGDTRKAERLYERARRTGIDPSVLAMHSAQILYGPLGHFDVAIAHLENAISQDPLSPAARWTLVHILTLAGRMTEALTAEQELRKLDSRVPGAYVYSGWMYLRAGDLPRARQMLDQARAITGDEFWNTALLVFAYDAAAGERDHARQLLDRLLERRARGEAASPGVIAEGYKALGDYERAFEWWARAVEMHDPVALITFPIRNRDDPVIGKDPRFRALLRRMGLEEAPAANGGQPK